MNYISTRDRSRTFTAAEAIVKGISDDGGLIVPSSFPLIDQKLFDELAAADYPERAAKVLSLCEADLIVCVYNRQVSAMTEIMAEEGVTSLTLEVRAGNLAARELYRKKGFREAGVRKGYYEDNGEDALIMWRRQDGEEKNSR